MQIKPFPKLVRLGFILVFTMAALLPAQTVFASGSVRHVKVAGLVSGNCLTWATACDLQYVLTSKAVAGDQVWVRQGVYMPGFSRLDSFVLREGVAVYGGFACSETLLSQRKPAVNITVLSGDIGNTSYLADNSYHVVTAGGGLGPGAVLDGFTIRAGNADDAGNLDNAMGAGLYNHGSPTLRNLVFNGNTALNNGGGLFNYGGSPGVSNVEFTGNSAGNYGGGMYTGAGSPVLTHVIFDSNSAGVGGGLTTADDNAKLTAVTFVANMAGSGGGMFNVWSGPPPSNPTLANVSFRSNWAKWGGGLYNNSAASTPILNKVTFSGNSATTAGGGLYNFASNIKLTAVSFKMNSGGDDGGGMVSENGTTTPRTATLNKVTFTGNSAANGGGIYNRGDTAGSTILKLSNVVFRGNTATTGNGGGLLNDNTVQMSRVTFAGNSAAIYGGGMLTVFGTVTLLNGTFSANKAARGGGLIDGSGTVALTNVTFSGNSASERGGTLVSSTSTSMVLKNVTMAANSAASGGAMDNNGSSPQLNNVTLSGNTAPTAAGIYNENGSHPVIRNTILWGNSTQELLNAGGSTVTLNYSVLKGACPAGVACTNVVHKDPLLGPLGNNGGFTKTMALLLGSSAIDKGNLCEPKDQRGVLRPQGSRCDIGAYEFIP